MRRKNAGDVAFDFLWLGKLNEGSTGKKTSVLRGRALRSVAFCRGTHTETDDHEVAGKKGEADPWEQGGGMDS